MMRLLMLSVALAAIASACDEPPASEPFARGRQLFQRLDCARCHTIDGAGGRLGPDLTHIGTLAGERIPATSAEPYIRDSVDSPGAYIVPGYNDVMPRGLARRLSEADKDALVLFLLEHR